MSSSVGVQGGRGLLLQYLLKYSSLDLATSSTDGAPLLILTMGRPCIVTYFRINFQLPLLLPGNNE